MAGALDQIGIVLNWQDQMWNLSQEIELEICLVNQFLLNVVGKKLT